MKRFEYKKYKERHHGEGLTNIIKTVGKKTVEKAATTIGDYAGKKAGDKLIELLRKRKTKTKPKPETLSDYELNEKLSQLLGGRLKTEKTLSDYEVRERLKKLI